MKKYDNYKDSGIEWIGDIPEHWNISKLKFKCKIFNGDSLKDDEKDEYSAIIENSIPYVSTKDIDLDTSKINYINGLKIPVENVKFKIAPKNSFLICIEGGSAGRKFAFVDEDIFFVNKLACFNSYENSNSRYLFFYIQSPLFQKQFQISMSGLIGGVAISLIRNFESLFPSIEEQTQIATYLDHKTSQIDTLISKKQQFITLLQEERIAVINQAVTKGLDPSVPMKDSGIEWLGEIPELWGLKKLKYLCKIINEKSSEKPDYVLALENIKSWTGEIIGNPYENKMEGDVNLFKENDILFNKLRPYLAKVIKTQSDGGCVGELLVLRANKFLTPTFLYYRLISEAIITIVDNSTYGTKMPRASWEKFISLIGIGFPSIDEQNEITDYIGKKMREIETLISKSEQEIELLKEYKTALISEVVTGKVDVREEVLN
jgi:restriction endonuclease S subunit